MNVTRAQAHKIGELVTAQLLNEAERNLPAARRTTASRITIMEMADGSGMPAIFTESITATDREHEVRVIVGVDGSAKKAVLR